MKSNIEIWRSSHNATDNVEFREYMKFMGIEPEVYEGVGLRFNPDLRSDETKSKLPAMVACLINPANELASVHMTYFKEGYNWITATTEPEHPILGSCARLFNDKEADSLIIATDITTALTVRALAYRRLLNTLIPCWATITPSTMRHMVVPENYTNVTVAIDNTVDYVSERAGYDLAHKLQGRGHKVSVMKPPLKYMDFNDQMRHADG